MTIVSRLLVLALVVSVGFYYRDEVKTFAIQSTHMISPCTIPISYSIDTIDPRFKLSTSSARKYVDQAVDIWEEAAGRDLFVPADEGVLRVRFVYDSRQATTQQLKDIGLDVSDDLSSYEQARARYESLERAYDDARARFTTLNAAYEKEASLYQAEVRRWNARGGAPPSVYEQLSQRKTDIERMEAELEQLQGTVNGYADDINMLVPTLNRLAGQLNISVATYNKVGEQHGEEFEEAVFQSRPGTMTITIFEYDSIPRLVRVLEHEIGHAIGLEHVDDPEAIMYRLNQGKNAALTPADSAELARHCRL